MESQNHPRNKHTDNKLYQKINTGNKRNQANGSNTGKKPANQKKSYSKLHKLEDLSYQELDAD